MSSLNTFNVAVTGSACFATKYGVRPFMEFDFNTSLMVRDALPDVIKRPGKPDIRILKYARVTRDTYQDVRRVSREIWGGKRSLFLPAMQSGEQDNVVDVSFILHLGMVALRWRKDEFRFETIARRDGYELPGDDGEYVDSAELKELGLPTTLSTSLDVERAWLSVKDKFPNVPSCVSQDAGLYFCEFRLYSSLAEPMLNATLHGKSGRTVSQHLPQNHTTDDIELARDITVTYITGVVESSLEEAGNRCS